VCSSPAVIAIADASPVDTGVFESLVVLSPSWPSELCPQQNTPPAVDAHVCSAPAATTVAPVNPKTCTERTVDGGAVAELAVVVLAQHHTLPSLRMPQLCASPAATDAFAHVAPSGDAGTQYFATHS